MNLKKLKKVATLAIATGLLATSTVSQATLITTVSGTFTGMAGGDSGSYLGEGTNHVFWGTNSPGFTQSSLEFVGFTYGGPSGLPELPLLSTGDTLNLGNLTLHNGTTLFGSEATSVTLNLQIRQVDDTTNTVVYTNADSASAGITTTLNIGDLVNDRDSICVTVTTTGGTLCQLANEGGTVTVVPVATLASIHIVDFNPITAGGAVTNINPDGTGVMKFIDDSGRLVVVSIPEPETLFLLMSGMGILALTRRAKKRA